MNNTRNIRSKAVDIITIYFGEDMAKIYNNFYEDKPAEIIGESVVELLTEYLGETVAKKQLHKFGIK
ncbi:hypothetical protein KKG22_00400 [Patescibacteria group bacterium]|nr:hypothetical protein [Patescibacteria group bacterium]MBU1722136.1 hypothetical protein [Patescibacteria group bacterium]MBU1901185.1 hypothetical protein [Patescibacteria group bacterium]